MKGKVEQLVDYHILNGYKNPVQLRKEVRNVVGGREAHKQPFYSMAQLIKMMTCLVQGKNDSNEDYKEVFESL